MTHTHFALVALGLCTTALTAPQDARAFSDPDDFEWPAQDGGGGGRFFTGSPVDGFDCSVCHQGAPAPSLELIGLPTEYVPGQVYEVQLAWQPSESGQAVVFEVVNPAGEDPAKLRLLEESALGPQERCGGDEASARASFEYERSGRHVLGVRECGASVVRFRFTGPQDSVVVFSASAVKSDGGETPEGDGAMQVSRVLRRKGVSAPSYGGAGFSCAATPLPSGGRAPLIFAAWLVWLLCGRRRSRPLAAQKVLVGTLLLVALLGGCARVAPYERGTLARRDMVLETDPDLKAGEEHAIAYREGSSGGGAAKGGGCGCN